MKIALILVSIYAAFITLLFYIVKKALDAAVRRIMDGTIVELIPNDADIEEWVDKYKEKVYEDVTLISTIQPNSDSIGLIWDFSRIEDNIVGVIGLEKGSAEELLKKYKPNDYKRYMEMDCDIDEIVEMKLEEPLIIPHVTIYKIEKDGEVIYTWDPF